MEEARRNYTPEEMVAILRRHQVEHEPVSQLGEQYQLQTTVFYRGPKQLFENGAAAFAPSPRADQQIIAYNQDS